MDTKTIEDAAALFVAARRTGALIDRLPDRCRPRSPLDAMAMQEATVRQLGERVAAWKVTTIDGVLVRGAILASRVFDGPARIPAKLVPMLGVEAEIAFRFDAGLPARVAEYSYEEVAAAVTALPAIEVVDSRFRDYQGTPVVDRSADCISNGGFVMGAARPDWRSFDLSKLEAVLEIDGKEIVRKSGGHASGDPLLPAVALANDLRRQGGLPAGIVVTTGTYTGLNRAQPGQHVTTSFTGFGAAEVLFEA